MRPEDPFKQYHKGGNFIPKDPSQYNQWSPQKLFVLSLLLMLPFVAVAIVLFLLGLNILAVIMTGLVISFMFLGLIYYLQIAREAGKK